MKLAASFLTGSSIKNPSGYGAGWSSASDLLSNIVAAVIFAIGIFFLLYLIFGGLKYMLAGGDDKAVQSAKKVITNAGVGISLAIGSFFIADIVGEVLGFNNWPITGGILAPLFRGPTAQLYPLVILNPTRYTSGGGIGRSSVPLGFLINNITTSILIIGGILLLVYLIFGAFKYMTAGGDDKATESAKKMMTNAVIGLLIMFVAFFIVRIAGSVLGMPDILSPTFPGP